MSIDLSKSKYCKCLQCEKILWLTKYKPDCVPKKNKDDIIERGKKVGELAKGLLGDYIDIPYDEDLSIMIEKTDELLKDKPNIITEASFSYNNNFCSVDILKNDLEGVEIYEVKSSTSLEDNPIYLDDVAYQYFVLSNLGLNVKKAYVVYLNKKYIRGEELDINQLFIKDDVTDIVRKKQDKVRCNVDKFNKFFEVHGKDNEPQKDIGIYCCKPYSCDFWEYCSRDLPKPNVFDLKGKMRKATKFKKYHEGKISFEDLQNDNLGDKYLEQIDFELHHREPKIVKEEIKKFLSSLNYPLYFIDYEAFQCAVPAFEGTHSYQQIPFQYSLHIIKEEGAPFEHKEFLAEIDDKNMIRNFAESMIKDLPENGSVIVYNQTFEESQVNKKICKMYPDLKDEIKRINANMVDIMVQFSDRNYYVKEMQGSASLKYVLPALYPDDPELDYDELSLVHKGDEASQAFLSLKDKTPKEQEEIKEALLEYCKLDTYAMVKIWEKFREVTI
ncbi:DUF2779 domain-containing protein [Methanobrevibacter sp.]|uniref:DUF2779 domain-containing protein n=1 Tax=Methanobrevibacter sp. TaxID=66852 RepID=UPI0038642315